MQGTELISLWSCHAAIAELGIVPLTLNLGFTDTKASFCFPASCFSFPFLSSGPAQTHTHIWSHQIPLLASLVLSCFISSMFHLCTLAVFHLSRSYDSSSSQHELMLVSPILNIQTHKTPFSHFCLSSYSHFPFNCDHTEGSDALAT